MTLGPGLPTALRLGDEPIREHALPSEVAGGEQCRRRVEVVLRQPQLLVDRAHAVAELQAGVPERVPQGRGEDVESVASAVVEQYEIQVAARRAGLVRSRPLPPGRRACDRGDRPPIRRWRSPSVGRIAERPRRRPRQANRSRAHLVGRRRSGRPRAAGPATMTFYRYCDAACSVSGSCLRRARGRCHAATTTGRLRLRKPRSVRRRRRPTRGAAIPG